MLLVAGNPVTLEEMRKDVKIQNKIFKATPTKKDLYTPVPLSRLFSKFLMSTPIFC